MNRRHTHVVSGLATCALVLALVPLPASAQEADAGVPPRKDVPSSLARADDLPNPLGDAHRALRKDAVNQLLTGEAEVVSRNGSNVIALTSEQPGNQGRHKGKQPPTKYVHYDVDREASVLTIRSPTGAS